MLFNEEILAAFDVIINAAQDEQEIQLINDLIKKLTQAKIEKVCPVCGKSFWAKHPLSVYCSQKCAKKYYNALTFERHKIEKVCPVCGEKFFVPPANKNQKCCSRTCSHKFRKLNQNQI